MSASWPDRVYLFAEARKVAEEFAQKGAPAIPVEGWGGPREDDTYTYMNALERLGPSMAVFARGQRMTGLDVPSFRPALPKAMQDLATAVQRLLDGELQPVDSDDIALITALGPDLLREAAAHSAALFERQRAPLFRMEAEFIADLRNAFEKVSRQLVHDVLVLRGMTGP